MNDGKFKVSVYSGYTPLADDEPVFAFRAKDCHMAEVLAFYAGLCEESGSPPEHVATVRNHRLATLAWQDENGCQVPD